MKQIPKIEDLKVHIRHILRPTYLAWTFGLLLIVVVIQSQFIYHSSNRRVDRTIDKYTYIKDRMHINKIQTESDRYTKVTTFYTEIAATYFQKYHKKYDKKDMWRYQGLRDDELTMVINWWYRGGKDLGIPYMLPPAIAVRESSGNPKARTFNKDGSILEAGLYNQRRGAAIQAKYYNSLMLPHLQARYDFKFHTMEDLLDPVNATKCELNLLWGEMMYFDNNIMIYVTSRHWGNGKIDKLVKNGVYPPKDFKFNIGKINEDVRNPFIYYFIINQYLSAFERFTVKVRLDKRYDEIYRKTCSLMEREYINGYKYFNEFVDLYDEIKSDKVNYYDKREKKIGKLEHKIRNLSRFYKDSRNHIKEGKFDSLKEYFTVIKNDTRKMVKEMETEKNTKIRRQLKFLLSSLLIVVLGIFGLLIAGTIKYFILKNKEQKK